MFSHLVTIAARYTFSKHAANVTRVRRKVTVDVTAQSHAVIENIFSHVVKSQEHPPVDDVTAQSDDGVGSR